MNRDLTNLTNVLSQLNTLINYSKTNPNYQIYREIIECVKVINYYLYGIENTLTETLSPDNIEKILPILPKWINTVLYDIDKLSIYYKKTDYLFYKLMLYITYATENQMLENALEAVSSIFSNEISKNTLIENWNLSSHLWGPFDPDNQIYDHLTNGIHELKKNQDKFISLYESLSDYRSKNALYSILNYWLFLDCETLNNAVEKNFSDYYDLDILQNISSNEIVVDCGAYDGDSALSYFDNFSSCKKMYLYDMIPSNLDKAKQNLKSYKNIIFRNAGVTCPEAENKSILIDNLPSPMMTLHENHVSDQLTVSNSTQFQIPLITLDHDITEPVTFIKMDIEGSELDALKGVKNHIKNNNPTLAICTYHHYSHMWEIPELILSYNPNYKLYMRFNGFPYSFTTSEYVLFAIPKP